MDFLGALKELVSVVLTCNAITGHEDRSMTSDYVDTLEYIMNIPSHSIDKN